MSKRSKQQRDRIFGGMILIICLGVVASVVYKASVYKADPAVPSQVEPSTPDVSEPTAPVTEPAELTADDPAVLTEYAPEKFNLTLLQPAELVVAGDIATYRFGDTQTLVVAPPSFNELLFSESGSVSEADTELDGMAAKQYVRTSAKDGSEYSVLQVVTDEHVYHLQGDAEFIANAANYISFK